MAESHLNKGNVERVDRRWTNNEISYFINFKKDDGEYQQMVIAEDGRILSNQLVSAAVAASTAAGASGTVQSGATTSATPTTQAVPYASVKNPVAMRNSVVVDRSTIPADVRRAIREQTRNGNVEEILQGDWSGKPVYQVAFTDENKKYVELQIDNAGQVIYDPRASTTATPATKPGTVLQNIGRALLDGQ